MMSHPPINPAFTQLGYVTNDLEQAADLFVKRG